MELHCRHHNHALDWSISIVAPHTVTGLASLIHPPEPMVRLELMAAIDNYYEVVTADDGRSHTTEVIRGSDFLSTAEIDSAVFSEHTHTAELSRSIRTELLLTHECLQEPWIDLDPLVSDIVNGVCHHVKSDTGVWDCKTVNVAVRFQYCHVCYEHDLLHNHLQQSFEEDRSCVTRPASKPAAMRMLKRLRFDGKNNDDDEEEEEEKCMVCLEELIAMEDQNEVLSMPCSHRFHGHCIFKWLDTSHFCPICRFEMPTEENVNN